MFSDAAIAAFKGHAGKEYPKEACGLIVDGDYLPRVNRAKDPETEFFITPQAILAAKKHGEILAVLHSHPGGPTHPTASDMRGQMDCALPWGLVTTDGDQVSDVIWFGDQVPIPPLIGRDFRHGVTDCYSLIRDWYRLERGITLKDYPRDNSWWEEGQDLYRQNFRETGFQEIPEHEARPGDVFLAQVRSAVPNHGGILLEGGLILHHLTGRLSAREPLGPWRRFVMTWLHLTKT